MDEIRVCIAGISGWVGREIARAVRTSGDLELCAGVGRRAAGQDAGAAIGEGTWSVPVHGSVAEALDGVDVLVDYTSHEAVRENVHVAIDRGVHVVVGASGLSGEDYGEIDEVARRNGVGVVAAGNFSVTAAAAKAAAVIAARLVPDWEIVDYAYAGKPDAPSGTAREIAEAMSAVSAPRSPDLAATGQPARGVRVGGSQVHSVRLPSFSVSTEIVFGAADERLTVRHDAGESAHPYVAGTLLAVRAVRDQVGLIRGLDRLLGVQA